MARKRRNLSKNFLAVRVNSAVSMGTLAAATFQSVTLMPNTNQDLWLISADLRWSLGDNAAGEGPIEVGISHGDYNVTEIKEWYESTAGIGSDMISRERSKRRCRESGMFSGNGTAEVLNDGKAVRTKLGFDIADGINLDFWVRNGDTGALAGTADVTVNGKVYCILK